MTNFVERKPTGYISLEEHMLICKRHREWIADFRKRLQKFMILNKKY